MAKGTVLIQVKNCFLIIEKHFEFFCAFTNIYIATNENKFKQSKMNRNNLLFMFIISSISGGFLSSQSFI